jgi:hypothetical protein
MVAVKLRLYSKEDERRHPDDGSIPLYYRGGHGQR